MPRCVPAEFLVAVVLLACTPWAVAQTPDIFGQIRPAAITEVEAVNCWPDMMNHEVPTAPFQRKRSLNDALGQIYEILKADGHVLPILVDREALMKSLPHEKDICQCRVELITRRRTMKVARVLRALLSQLPHPVTFKIWAGSFLEITTPGDPPLRLPMPPLEACVNVTALREMTSVYSALNHIYRANLAGNDAQCCILVDKEAFEMAPAGLNEVPFVVAPWVRCMTVRELLTSALRQVPGANATFVATPGYICITTRERARQMKRLLEIGLVVDGVPIEFSPFDASIRSIRASRPRPKEAA